MRRPVRLHREDRRQHREARGVGGRHRHAGARDPERGLDHPRPRQPAEARVQGSEPARQARNSARAGPDRVVDELLAERDLQLHRRRSRSRGHVDEAVEVPGLGPVPVDRVPTAEQAGHHRLGDARGETGRNGRIRRGSALFEDLDPRRHGRGVSGGDSGGQHRLLPYSGPRSRPAVSSFTPRGDSGDLDRRRPHGPHQGSQAGADREARPQRDGHRLARGPDRDAHAVGSTT